ncbi:hypothetical protein AB0D49_38265 [Streptomyces sp. NPDC048290]|uniref:hypothetical protein n=1 Tax=Streptomyces sp. NPDC048290 TaxID=3155811 RepID=UPI003412FC87
MKGVVRFGVRLVRHELRLLGSLALWLARRRHGGRLGELFPSARGLGPMMFGFGFVAVVETVVLSVLLARWPTVHLVVLVLDVYTVLFVAGLYAAAVVRPHVLEPDAVRLRYAGHVELRVPLERIARVRRELLLTHTRADGELNIGVAGQTTVTVELTEPVEYVTFLGRRRPVRTVRVNADEPAAFVRALVAAGAGAGGDAVAPGGSGGGAGASGRGTGA